MLFIGNLVYVLCLLTNALAILSDDRFLARIGLSTSTYDPAFGAGADANSVKAKLVALIASVRMVMRRTFPAHFPFGLSTLCRRTWDVICIGRYLLLERFCG
ncbi:hypothetical protein MKX07_002830 [Trichoderma sp. CBMAI-0711]|nr:hypothetical protein MKX07_002830 [Trichoderma sp. CBMAI-0711]